MCRRYHNAMHRFKSMCRAEYRDRYMYVYMDELGIPWGFGLDPTVPEEEEEEEGNNNKDFHANL